MARNEETIGRRIRRLREQAGLSQEQLAVKLKLTRPAVSNLETDRRKLTPGELIGLAGLFDVSSDVLLGLEQEPEVVLPSDGGRKKAIRGMRINVPQKNLAKFREVLLYILQRVGARPHVGETVIYKLLYFIDFDYYEKHEEQLIGATYIANRFGPTPVEFGKIVREMEKSGELHRLRGEHFNYPQRRYLPGRKPDLSVLNGQELQLVDDVLKRLGDMNASQISAYSHNDVPWLGTPSGEPIPYEAVFYRQQPYSQREDTEDS